MSEALLSMGDIARLAKVKRPVVSMWRQRQRTRVGSVAFPEPAVTSPAERFRADDVLQWLEDTGRGNNPDAAIDMALVRVGGGHGALRPARRVVLESLVTLQALRGAGLGGLDEDTLIDLADELDPDDRALFGEISRADEDLPTLAVEADELCEAAFGAAPALDRLRALAGLELTGSGVQFVRDLTWELSRQFVEPFLLAGLESSTQLAADLLGTVPEEASLTVLVPDLSVRWLRRHLITRGISSLADSDGPVLRLLALEEQREADLLDRIDDLQLELRPGDVGLVVGPAAVLTDRLPAVALETQRDSLLRLGALRHVVRLPAGLNTRASRQSLALWVLAPRAQTAAPADRTVLVSDLTGRPLDTVTTDQLIGDMVADLTSTHAASTHAFALARVVGLPALIAGRGALVPSGTRPERFSEESQLSTRAEQVLRTRGVLAQLAEPRPTRFGDVSVGAAAPPSTRRRVPGELLTLEDLIAEDTGRVIPGSRLDLDRLADGTVPVITADDVLDHAGRAAHAAISVDPLDLARLHPRARRVEEGDVVFVTSPRPAAVACRDPGAVVAFPARILRVLGSELVPELVAALINALPATDKRWRGWAFPRADHTAHEALTDLLRAIEDERADLATRHTQLDELTHLLTAGPARGTLTISTTEGDH